MIIRLIVASVIVVAPATFAVGYWQGQHQGEAPAVVGVRLNAPILTKPGYGAAAAAKYFAALNAPPPPPPPPGPVLPDVGLVFRRDVTAVTTDKTPHVILADGRQLVRGQEYRDGWKVREVTTESVLLAKGSETRSVNLFSAPAAPAPPPVAAIAGAFGQISLTNGARAGQLGAGAISRILSALRELGLSQAQLDQLQRTLAASSSFSQQQAIQMINTAVRGRALTQIQINNLVQAFVSAGVLQQNAVFALTQQLFAQQQNQQLQGILRGPGAGGGGGPNGGFGAPRGGFGGPNGGFGGRRGGLGLTQPNITPGAAPAAAPSPAASALPQRAQLEPTSQPFRLARLTGQFQPDRATPQ
jgi:hypothetical protein